MFCDLPALHSAFPISVYAGVGDGRNRLLRKRAAPDLALVRDERSDAPVARSSADTMNGLLSHAPSPIAVRLAVGGLMLGQAQALILFAAPGPIANRSEEHTSDIQSLMRISYAVFCLKKKK